MTTYRGILLYDNFLARIRDWATTAAYTPPWARAQFWAEHMVPFIQQSYESGDRAVKAVLDEGRPKMMESEDCAFDWLASFLSETEESEVVRETM